MDKTYVAAIYERFDGLYYTVRYPDFNDYRGEDLDCTSGAKAILQRELQALIDHMKAEGKSIPEPNIKKYAHFRSSYGSECEYVEITVKV